MNLYNYLVPDREVKFSSGCLELKNISPESDLKYLLRQNAISDEFF